MVKSFLGLIFLLLFSSAKAQSVASRLQSMSSAVYEGSVFDIKDSLEFFYSGKRGSIDMTTFHPNGVYGTHLTDTMKIYKRNIQGGVLSYQGMGITSYDNSDNILVHYRLDGINLFMYKTVYHYTASGRLASSKEYIYNYLNSQWTINTMDTFQYNSSGAPLSQEHFTSNGGTSLLPKEKHIYTFTSSGNSIDSMFISSAGVYQFQTDKTTYYGKESRVDSVVQFVWGLGTLWPGSSKRHYFYNSNNNLTSEKMIVYNTVDNVWQNSSEIIYSYTGNVVNSMEVREWDNLNGKWIPKSKNLYTYDVNANLTSDTYQKWTGTSFMDSNRIVLTYNNFNQPLTRLNETKIAGAWSNRHGDSFLHYYYETYPTNINSYYVLKNDLELYPSPTKSIVNIHAKFLRQCEINCSIIDMQGKLMLQWKESTTTEYNKVLPVSSFSPGQYLLKIEGKSLSLIAKFLVSE